jgi:hypothetical protein
MSSLLNLPSELLLNIVSTFRPPQRSIESDVSKIDTLQNLCLACKLLRFIAQPLLFESIGFVSENGSYSFRQLAAVLEASPQLAERARTWYLEPTCLLQESQNRPKDEVWNPADVPRALDTALRLKNVKTLHLLGSRYHWAHPMGNLGEDILESYKGLRGDQPALPHLTTLCIAPKAHATDQPGCFVNIAQWRDFLEHPRIETVCIQYGVVANPFTHWHSPYREPRSSNLTSLHLERCYFTRLGLTKFLGTCKALKTFHFTAMDEIQLLNIPGTGPGTPEFMTPSDFVDILRMCTDTLEHLSLDFSEWIDEYAEFGLDEFDDELSYSNLQDFVHLIHLKVELQRLDNPVELPAALQSLTVIHCRQALMGRAPAFMAEYASKTCPLLRLIQYEGYNERDDHYIWEPHTTREPMIEIVLRSDWPNYTSESWYAGYERWRKVGNVV